MPNIPIERVENLVEAAYREGLMRVEWHFTEARAALLRLREEVKGE